MPTNQDIAACFYEIANLLELQNAGFFQVLAYRRAAEHVAGEKDDITKKTKTELLKLPGIGGALADKIIEYGATKKMKFLIEQRKDVPASLVKMLAIPSLGPKKVRLLWQTLNIDTIAKLRSAAKKGKLRQLTGFGEKSEEKILAGIGTAANTSKNKRLPIADVKPIAAKILRKLRVIPGTEQIAVAGSLRRGSPTIGDVDILATSDDSEALMQAFTTLPDVATVIGSGHTKSSVRLQDGLQVDLRVVPDNSFGAALQYFTGSKEHNVKIRERAVKRGMKVNEYGIFDSKTGEQLGGEKEGDIYRILGLKFVQPKNRLGKSEVEGAVKKLT